MSRRHSITQDQDRSARHRQELSRQCITLAQLLRAGREQVEKQGFELDVSFEVAQPLLIEENWQVQADLLGLAVIGSVTNWEFLKDLSVYFDNLRFCEGMFCTSLKKQLRVWIDEAVAWLRDDVVCVNTRVLLVAEALLAQGATLEKIIELLENGYVRRVILPQTLDDLRERLNLQLLAE